MKIIKRAAFLLAALCCCLFALSACGKNENKNPVPPESSVLVAYFSATGTTKGVAETITEITGGTLYEIKPQIPYTQEDLNYTNSSARATAEQRDPNARPEIEGSISDMGAFDVVYLGYPIWHGTAPKIIDTFLESYDFSGKTIIPFCTSGSSGIAASVAELKKLAGNAAWLSGKRFSSASKSEAEAWIGSLNG